MNDESTGHDPDEEFEGEEPRSIFSALWFRLVIGVAALSVVTAVAVPYILDWARPPVPAKSTATGVAPSMPGAAPATPTPPAIASTPSPLPETAKPLAPASSAPAAMWTPSTPSAQATPSVAAAASAGSAIAPEPKTAAGPVAAGSAGPTAKPLPTGTAPSSSAAGKGGLTTALADTSTSARVAPAKATARMAGDASAGSYWVQVGAYKDATTAERLAAKLREQGYHVSELAPTTPSVAIAAAAPPAPAAAPEPTAPRVDRYDVIVSGAPAATVTERLVAKGLVADVTSAGVIVRPALSLPEAISLSKDLAADGLKVQVRRAGIVAARTPAIAKPPTAPASPAPDGLHRVRVGAYPDHATALAAVKDLSARGYEGFVARVAP